MADFQTDLDAAQKAIEALRGDGRPEIIRKASEALLKVMIALRNGWPTVCPIPIRGCRRPEPPVEPTEPTEPSTKPV